MDEEYEYVYEDSVPVLDAEKAEPGSLAAFFERINIFTLLVMILGYTVSKYLMHKYLAPMNAETPDEDAEPSPTAAKPASIKGNAKKGTSGGGAFTPPPTATPADVPAPRDESFTPAELCAYDGTDPNAPVYLAIKGTVFDVSRNRSAYAPDASYSVFAGKDASRALGKSSLKKEDCVADTAGMTEQELQTLEQWLTFYKKRYPIVGKVV
ncbi:hypothetical protein HDU87_000540 [Geranomyces variabilis]|uniref:Cytochrome b5 heme-binding domain-containing protein n=1 Tax=Geranomyces variabilis TaxID=109894 RepID=A0AAD5TCJ2_9FUNG|nr:hypothetical protein HDU87_000540 [Geranomyces variabilis]